MSSNVHLDNFLNPIAEILTHESANRLAELRIDSASQVRLDQLAEKSTEGVLTDEERTEYEAYIHAIDFLAVLQAQAKQRLDRNSAS